MYDTVPAEDQEPTTSHSRATEEEEEEGIILTVEDVMSQLTSVSVDWQPLRGSHECVCGYPFDGNLDRRTHCRRCGRLFCNRCVVQKAVLPGHESKKPTPVCNDCHKALALDKKNSSSSMKVRQEDSLL